MVRNKSLEYCLVSSHLSPDTDEDGILDSQDPFPLDPWSEFILFRNEDGRIDLMFSNRTQIQTLEKRFKLEMNMEVLENTEYRYTEFVIADFDSNGQMDFLAIGDSDPEDLENDIDVWYFWRSKADEFHQRLLEPLMPSHLVPVLTLITILKLISW